MQRLEQSLLRALFFCVLFFLWHSCWYGYRRLRGATGSSGSEQDDDGEVRGGLEIRAGKPVIDEPGPMVEVPRGETLAQYKARVDANGS
jgi:hypothetical protein